jgi:hypothetical protein
VFRASAGLETCFGLLTGQSVPIFRCRRKSALSDADLVMFLTTSDDAMLVSRSEFLHQPGAVARAALPWIPAIPERPMRSLCRLPTLHEPQCSSTRHSGRQLRKTNMNTLAQAEDKKKPAEEIIQHALPPAPHRGDLAIVASHKRKLARLSPLKSTIESGCAGSAHLSPRNWPIDTRADPHSAHAFKGSVMGQAVTLRFLSFVQYTQRE